MYKQTKTVIEDVVVGKECPGIRKHFTGGESKLELPVTVSFLDEGEYKVHITGSHVFVEKLPTLILKEEKTLTLLDIKFRLNEIEETLKLPVSPEDREKLTKEHNHLSGVLKFMRRE